MLVGIWSLCWKVDSPLESLLIFIKPAMWAGFILCWCFDGWSLWCWCDCDELELFGLLDWNSSLISLWCYMLLMVKRDKKISTCASRFYWWTMEQLRWNLCLTFIYINSCYILHYWSIYIHISVGTQVLKIWTLPILLCIYIHVYGVYVVYVVYYLCIHACELFVCEIDWSASGYVFECWCMNWVNLLLFDIYSYTYIKEWNYLK